MNKLREQKAQLVALRRQKYRTVNKIIEHERMQNGSDLSVKIQATMTTKLVLRASCGPA